MWNNHRTLNLFSAFIILLLHLWQDASGAILEPVDANDGDKGLNIGSDGFAGKNKGIRFRFPKKTLVDFSVELERDSQRKKKNLYVKVAVILEPALREKYRYHYKYDFMYYYPSHRVMIVAKMKLTEEYSTLFNISLKIYNNFATFDGRIPDPRNFVKWWYLVHGKYLNAYIFLTASDKADKFALGEPKAGSACSICGEKHDLPTIFKVQLPDQPANLSLLDAMGKTVADKLADVLDLDNGANLPCIRGRLKYIKGSCIYKDKKGGGFSDDTRETVCCK